MKLNSIKEIALFEHRFWLQVLGDHSRFIFNALSPREKLFIQQASHFIKRFDALLEKARTSISEEELSALNLEAYSAAVEIRELKLSIIAKQIEDKINISMPPTFINHMVNELDEYIFVLNALLQWNMPATCDIHLHLLWLPDGSGHASAIAGNLDMTQKSLIEEARKYSKTFKDLYLRTIEYNGYTRTGICDFSALRKHNIDVDESMSCFKEFLKALRDFILEKKVLGTLDPLMADHMLREECYYLTKLSMVFNTKAPECDPTKPRIP